LVAYEFLRCISAYGGSTNALTSEDIACLRVPIPPLGEQKRIVSLIESKESEVQAIRSVSERTIAVLREYRSALITAAVTGQLNLRKHEKKMEALA
jgi:type I restriction enzyme S subunit